MRRQHNINSGGGEDWPTGYTRLDYLQSTGTQYINTGIIPTTGSSYSCTIDCQFTEMKSYTQHGYGNDTCDLNYSSSGYMSLNSIQTYLGLDRHTVKIAVTYQSGSSYNKAYWVDDVQKTSYSSKWFATNDPICVFCTKPFWSSSDKSYLKVYSYTIETGGTVVCECYPAMRNSDSVLGMLDVKTNNFYTNQGTGTFLYGLPTVPSVPTNVTASMANTGTTVSWSDSTGATSYKVYRSSTESGTYSLLTTLNALTYNDTTPLSGYNYYKIVATNTDGDSNMSSAASINFVVPSAPTNVTGTKSGNNIVVSWSEVSNATQYTVYRCSTSDGTYTSIGTTNFGTTSFSDTTPLTGDNYYKVGASNGAGNGTLSSYVYVDNSGGSVIPFSEYLVFYAPLTENDLTDHISGSSPTTMSSCTKTWDSTKQMWLLKSEPNMSGYYVSPLSYQGLTSVPVINSSNPITLVIDVAGVNAGNNYCAMIIVPDWSTAGKSYGTAYMGEVRFGGIDTNVHRYVGVFINNTVTWYKDGVQTGSASWTFSNPYTGARGVAICMANDTNKYHIYASNARIYNKAFTAAEVAQL